MISLPASEEPEAVIGSLDAYRPIGATLPEAAVAEAQRREFFHQMHRWIRQGSAAHVFCKQRGEQERFRELWGIRVVLGRAGGADGPPGALREDLNAAAGAVVVTDAEIYGRYKVSRARRLKSPHAQAVRSALRWISRVRRGRLRCIPAWHRTLPRTDGAGAIADGTARRPRMQAADRSALVIEYAPREPGEESPKLYVPVTEAHLVSKYVAPEGASAVERPRWNLLEPGPRAGGIRSPRPGQRPPARAGDARSTGGDALAGDTHWQQEFEAAFEYEETPDQVTAIAAVKRDQESARPMDRLLSGDVGFGKTEVAIRAAFKAVMSGRQAARLVPTNRACTATLQPFPGADGGISGPDELLSRFRSPKQVRASSRPWRRGRRTSSLGPTACRPGRPVSRPRFGGGRGAEVCVRHKSG